MDTTTWSKNSAKAAATQAAPADNNGYTKTVTTAPSQTITSTSGSGSRNTTDTTKTTRMTPESLAALQNLIEALQNGGTNEQRASAARREQALQLTQGLLNQVSTERAFSDAEALMALELQRAAERNLPAIQRAVEGAGTSASSMQAVLAQQAQRDAALAAGALGAQQAQVYAQQRSALANTLEALTRKDDTVTKALLEALNISKGAVENTSRNTSSSTSSFSRQVVDNPESTITETFIPFDSTPSSEASVAAYNAFPSRGYDYSQSFWKPVTTDSLVDLISNYNG